MMGGGDEENGTLAVEVGVTVAVTVPFVTSSVTPTPERERDGNTDSVSGTNLRTQRPSERFVISSDSSHHSSPNAADAEVASLVRFSVPPPPMMNAARVETSRAAREKLENGSVRARLDSFPPVTAAVTTTNVAGASSAPVLGEDAKPVSQVHPNIFADSTSIGATWPDVAGPSNPADTELSVDTFYVSQEMDFETLRKIYVPKWNVINESFLDDPDVCRSVIDQLPLLASFPKFAVWIMISFFLSLILKRHVKHALALSNYGVICEDMLKGAYFGAKTKTFEDFSILTNTPYLGKEIRRISAKSSQEKAYL
nr:hypothetical protein [Tanacetum cinerariifolium]